MDFCQESETVLENNENKKIEDTEETVLTLSCPDERSERNHVCCLLSISDLTLNEDERASEFAINTGWEEAVHGWGRTSPTACIWSRKRVKRGRVGEGTSGGSNCLLCMSLSQGSPEARSLLEGGKSEVAAVVEVSPQKSWSNPSQGPSTASKEPSKPCFPTHLNGEKKSLQTKEFIWCMEEWAFPETVSSKDCRNPSRITDQGLSISSSLASNALVVLPPLKISPPNNLDVLNKKSKNVFWQPEEKVLRVGKDESVACTDGLKTVDGKGEKNLDLASRLKVTNILPFPTPVARTHLLATESQGCCMRWSVLPPKSSLYSHNPTNIHYLATLQVLHKQGVQSYRTSLKAKEPKAPRRHILTEAKQHRHQPLVNKVFPKPLLPSLTVSRVIIPVSTHRVL
ncbi:uncharacterized protein C16orf46 homolog [Psammomys obesus]|uniref:uncharacterized protein C16orf46 homolog n=1 Tax=Psammomys obesus TaxID=48139 RepID=UPI0024528B59|nr:uncharacterized protein C16orf46 homolog [Psammomys obesus]XP_055477533.1 uncharacterized protein C16orf46 homolog [Psammomys obesus]XP_055477534.1 uncharacterized protein C16orf46 homolog [Psammomys obesus]